MTTASAAPARPAAASRTRREQRPPSFRVRAAQALRAEGYRMTAQRHALLDVIERAGGHLDADELFRRVRRRAPRISLSTVYRSLHLLTRHELVDELRLAQAHHCYEPRTGGPRHFHLVCVDCGGIQEVHGDILDGLPEALRRERGFRVTGVRLEVLGHCGRCVAGA